MNALALGLAIAGGIALLAAWVWLAWALLPMVRINGRSFRPTDLASIAAIMAAGADVDFLKQIQTLVDLANKGFVGLARAILQEFWRNRPTEVMRAAYALSGELARVAVKEYPLSKQWLKDFEVEEEVRRADLKSRLMQETPEQPDEPSEEPPDVA